VGRLSFVVKTNENVTQGKRWGESVVINDKMKVNIFFLGWSFKEGLDVSTLMLMRHLTPATMYTVMFLSYPTVEVSGILPYISVLVTLVPCFGCTILCCELDLIYAVSRQQLNGRRYQQMAQFVEASERIRSLYIYI
jgi:hypothetical protein